MQTGFGRTGRVFAFQHWGLEPDLVPVAKSLSGGYVPVGGLLMSRAVHEAVFDSMEHAVSHGSTFAPNELGMAAGLATLRELRGQRLVEESARLGTRLLELTRPLVDEFEVVSEVRGLGLMWAIEFAEPRSGSRSWRLMERMQKGLFAQLVVGPLFSKHRILTQVAGHNMAVVKVLPPLVLSDVDVEEFAGALRDDDRIRPAHAGVADEVRAVGRSAALVRRPEHLEVERGVRRHPARGRVVREAIDLGRRSSVRTRSSRRQPCTSAGSSAQSPRH